MENNKYVLKISNDTNGVKAGKYQIVFNNEQNARVSKPSNSNSITLKGSLKSLDNNTTYNNLEYNAILNFKNYNTNGELLSRNANYATVDVEKSNKTNENDLNKIIGRQQNQHFENVWTNQTNKEEWYNNSKDTENYVTLQINDENMKWLDRIDMNIGPMYGWFDSRRKPKSANLLPEKITIQYSEDGINFLDVKNQKFKNINDFKDVFPGAYIYTLNNTNQYLSGFKNLNEGRSNYFVATSNADMYRYSFAFTPIKAKFVRIKYDVQNVNNKYAVFGLYNLDVRFLTNSSKNELNITSSTSNNILLKPLTKVNNALNPQTAKYVVENKAFNVEQINKKYVIKNNIEIDSQKANELNIKSGTYTIKYNDEDIKDIYKYSEATNVENSDNGDKFIDINALLLDSNNNILTNVGYKLHILFKKPLGDMYFDKNNNEDVFELKKELSAPTFSNNQPIENILSSINSDQSKRWDNWARHLHDQTEDKNEFVFEVNGNSSKIIDEVLFNYWREGAIYNSFVVLPEEIHIQSSNDGQNWTNVNNQDKISINDFGKTDPFNANENQGRWKALVTNVPSNNGNMSRFNIFFEPVEAKYIKFKWIPQSNLNASENTKQHQRVGFNGFQIRYSDIHENLISSQDPYEATNEEQPNLSLNNATITASNQETTELSPMNIIDGYIDRNNSRRWGTTQSSNQEERILNITLNEPKDISSFALYFERSNIRHFQIFATSNSDNSDIENEQNKVYEFNATTDQERQKNIKDNFTNTIKNAKNIRIKFLKYDPTGNGDDEKYPWRNVSVLEFQAFKKKIIK
ncbi:discoidin domain-containing protein [Mycoplasma sp. CSL7503-lung]|uniref:discoidin domain-containing protein n=1 Tax=Mycoplasma sp. CSL7503-lung TaxID=536372 RepID=UPI0021D22836|nr:discoidin domain-containing protein [Mycoplasma sp. CSL7503-lung]MCU4706965.1 discoidin domain-containing protein [Mycoplasma sp. CSL7503-lung]